MTCRCMKYSSASCPADGGDRLAVLTFSREQLLYDIENYAWVEGDVMRADDAHRPHPVQDIGEAGNIDRVTRVLDLAHAEAVEMLYPYSKRVFGRLTPPEGGEGAEAPEEPQGDVGDDDVLRETATYEIRLKVPGKFSLTTVRLLERLVHEYMVCRVLEDWMGITFPDAQQLWADKVRDIEEKITSCMNARTGRVRRTLTPW